MNRGAVGRCFKGLDEGGDAGKPESPVARQEGFLLVGVERELHELHEDFGRRVGGCCSVGDDGVEVFEGALRAHASATYGAQGRRVGGIERENQPVGGRRHAGLGSRAGRATRGWC
jgi:hypothetical protein